MTHGLQIHRNSWCSQAPLLAITVLGLAGCGASGPFDYVKVDGKITYEDGSTIPLQGETRLMFSSLAPAIEEKYHARPATGYVDAEGNLSSITSYKYGDGLVPGKHKVIISAVGSDGRILIPPEYSDTNTTPLEIDTADSPLKIKIRKPTEAERKAVKAPQPKY